MGRLGDHPNIMPIHDLGDENGQPYMVQPLMDGAMLVHSLNVQRTVGCLLRRLYDLPARSAEDWSSPTPKALFIAI